MRKLCKSEINRIVKENFMLSNEELIKKYFDILYSDVLGSQAERMDEAGYEESDRITCGNALISGKKCLRK